MGREMNMRSEYEEVSSRQRDKGLIWQGIEQEK